jgi:hypothetical protein
VTRARRQAAALRAPSSVPLDAAALEAVDRFARVLARCGCTPAEILGAVGDACARLPKKKRAKAREVQRELSVAPHILTFWFSDALYLDRSGRPIRLPVGGPAPSLEAIISRVDATLDVQEVLRYLKRANVLVRHGSLYAPRRRTLSLRGQQPVSFRNLRSLVGLLRNLDHNLQPKRAARGWFEYSAENPAFPAHARAALDTRLEDVGIKFLHEIDTYMHRRELERAPGERTVRMSVGVYRFEDDGTEEPASAQESVRRGRRTGRRKGRRSG